MNAFLIDHPDMSRSLGAQIVSDPITDLESSTLGYTLTSMIIVRSTDADLVGQLALEHHLQLTPADPSRKALKDFHLLAAPNIRAAALACQAIASRPGIQETYLDISEPMTDRFIPSDPLLIDQWHLNNTLYPLGDINVFPAWSSGYTGLGVTICMIESGWDINHPDLAPRYQPLASQPDNGFSSHGTSTAGLAAASANGLGTVGVAFDAGLSRVYRGATTQNADAFLFQNNLNHIKSNSWGPIDNARVSVMPSIVQAAIDDAAINGRNGLGTVIVWAGGNGRAVGDRVDYDAYASNRRAIAVGAIDESDNVASYSEPGSSLMLVVPSSPGGGSMLRNITTTTTGDSYTSNFGGTSASAPIASGVVALMLSANPTLTARDVQHILINTARKCNPGDPGWILNGAGRWVSYDYGFGAIDAQAAVQTALTWRSVEPEVQFVSPIRVESQPLPDYPGSGPGVSIESMIVVPRPMRVERAQVVLNLPHSSIGQVRIELVSPAGIPSLVADVRGDNSSNQYQNYVLTSVRHWGENAVGSWRLRVSDLVSGSTGTLDNWQLIVEGTNPACPCDWDLSGQVKVSDIFAFLSSWFSGAGDMDQDNDTDVADIFAYLSCFFTHIFGPC